MFDRAAKFFAKEIIVLMKIQLPDRILNLMRAWFWTVEIVSLVMVALCWSSASRAAARSAPPHPDPHPNATATPAS